MSFDTPLSNWITKLQVLEKGTTLEKKLAKKNLQALNVKEGKTLFSLLNRLEVKEGQSLKILRWAVNVIEDK